MKPIIFYVDDEPMNLVVFEAACPDTWTVRTFESAVDALAKMDVERPSVIVSDQRMPSMTGVQFLEVAKKICPDAVRIIVTGYSDEDLIVESVRKAAIFDYIKKPWDVDDILASLGRAIDFHQAATDRSRLQEELLKREAELIQTNSELKSAMKDVEIARHKEADLRKELECWVPPFVLWALKDHSLQPETKRNVVGIAFDIIGSSRLHDARVATKSARSQVIQNFSESVLRHGGWRESHSGDSAYGHFGLSGDESALGSPPDSALSAAREFRASLRNLSAAAGTEIECGIALHIARECPIHVHTVHLNTPFGAVTQKSFDTSSADVDLLHRMEKLVHQLPGTNIVMTRTFVDGLKQKPSQLVELGHHVFRGQSQPVELLLLPGDLVKENHINELRASLSPADNVIPMVKAA